MKHTPDHILNHKVVPSERTWKSIRSKLAKRKANQKVAFYRNLSIAAGIIAIISITIGFTSQWNYNVFYSYLSGHSSAPIAFEELPIIENDPFYDYSKILTFDKIILEDPSILNGNSENFKY